MDPTIGFTSTQLRKYCIINGYRINPQTMKRREFFDLLYELDQFEEKSKLKSKVTEFIENSYIPTAIIHTRHLETKQIWSFYENFVSKLVTVISYSIPKGNLPKYYWEVGVPAWAVTSYILDHSIDFVMQAPNKEVEDEYEFNMKLKTTN